MHFISRRPFSEAAKVHPNHRRVLEDLFSILRKSDFDSPDKMRCMFPSLDNSGYRGKWWVIDAAGNHLRVIAFIQFAQRRVYVKHILTHAEYDKICNRYARGDMR